MKCLLKYQWVKLPRTHLPAGKGVMGYWARLTTKAFEEVDAWLDLWCHTIRRDPRNICSGLAPVVQYGHCGAF
ncbi:MAG: hypothetical protein LBK56_08565 [Gracilibacteraceae bacterium]|jgi:hypothetical protein|nr:hypothetical protein [Gracilibacteraceae bacterium]